MSQARRREGGDSAVNVESAAAAAQAAAAAASASAEIAPQVFTQALAKIEAFKIPVRFDQSANLTDVPNAIVPNAIVLHATFDEECRSTLNAFNLGKMF